MEPLHPRLLVDGPEPPRYDPSDRSRSIIWANFDLLRIYWAGTAQSSQNLSSTGWAQVMLDGKPMRSVIPRKPKNKTTQRWLRCTLHCYSTEQTKPSASWATKAWQPAQAKISAPVSMSAQRAGHGGSLSLYSGSFGCTSKTPTATPND